jgi:hypothetical protein
MRAAAVSSGYIDVLDKTLYSVIKYEDRLTQLFSTAAGTFTALLHVSAKLYCHQHVVYISLEGSVP